MRIACIGPESASTRVRFDQFAPVLAGMGHETRSMTWRPRSSHESARLAVAAIRLARWADVLVLLKPRLPARLTDVLGRVGASVVVDVDDAIWEWSPAVAGRWHHALRRARLAIVGSDTLADEVARMAPSVPVRCIRPALDVAAYATPATRVPPRADGRPVVGWIGGSLSLTDFVPAAVTGLGRLVEADAAELRIVCSEPLVADGLVSTFVPWSTEREAAEVAAFSVGVMPLRDDPTSRGRSGLKVIQYMAAGLPVVASPVGVACELVEPGVTGFLAVTADEWGDALARLLGDPELRRAMGARAQTRAWAELDLAPTATRMVDAYTAARGPGGVRSGSG